MPRCSCPEFDAWHEGLRCADLAAMATLAVSLRSWVDDYDRAFDGRRREHWDLATALEGAGSRDPGAPGTVLGAVEAEVRG